jgi:predicted nucleic acid-binding protein
LSFADTSPINYLVCIDYIAVLPKLYGRILIPPAVCEELLVATAVFGFVLDLVKAGVFNRLRIS